MTHACHAEGCGTRVHQHKLMCMRHWSMVPKIARRRVFHYYVSGQCNLDPAPSKEWREAAADAIEAVALKERVRP